MHTTRAAKLKPMEIRRFEPVSEPVTADTSLIDEMLTPGDAA